MQRLAKFLGLTNSDRRLLIKTFVLLGWVRLGLGLLPWHKLRQFLSVLSLKNRQIHDLPTIEQIVWAVTVSSRYTPGGAKCLARALTTQILMSRYGYVGELRIGVAKGEQGQFLAHAWVESQGQIVIGYLQDLSRYTPMNGDIG